MDKTLQVRIFKDKLAEQEITTRMVNTLVEVVEHLTKMETELAVEEITTRMENTLVEVVEHLIKMEKELVPLASALEIVTIRTPKCSAKDTCSITFPNSNSTNSRKTWQVMQVLMTLAPTTVYINMLKTKMESISNIRQLILTIYWMYV